MAVTISKSKVVSMKPSICSHNGCINRVAEGNLYCTLHDINPMFPTKNKVVMSKGSVDVKGGGHCCLPLWTIFTS